jgi:hypothetical protein
MKLFITSSLLSTDILLIALFSNTLKAVFFLNITDQVSHPQKTTGKTIVFYILMMFLERRWEEKR